MALDGIFTHALAAELQIFLESARIDRVFQPQANDLLLQLHGSGRKMALRISANPSMPCLYLSEQRFRNPEVAPGFCMLLRKHLIGAQVLTVTCPDRERIVRFELLCRNDFGDLVRKTLVAELIGKYSNIVLLDENGIIHDAIRHVDHSVNRFRELMPARPYLAPPAQSRQDPEDLLQEADENPDFATEGFRFLMPENVLKLSSETDANPAEQKLEVFIMQAIKGFSPRLAQELLFRSALDNRMKWSHLDQAKRLTLSNCLLELLREILQEDARPALYFESADLQRSIDFHALKLHQFPFFQTYETLSQCLDKYFGQRTSENDFAQKKQVVQKEINRQKSMAARKLELHLSDLESGKQAALHRRYGVLLAGQAWSVPANAESAELIDYEESAESKVTVPLLSMLSASANAERYFQLYRKAKVRTENAERFLVQDRTLLETLSELESSLTYAEDLTDLQAVKNELKTLETRKESSVGPDLSEQKHLERMQLNPGKPGKNKKKFQQTAKVSKKGKEDNAFGPRRFQSPEGNLIEVGRNNLQNDELSLGRGRKNDYWFHVKNHHGSHVILHCDTDTPTDREIELCAHLAAWYSAGCRKLEGVKVEVDYCPLRMVTRLPGGTPGHVQYRQFQTVLIQTKAPTGHSDLERVD